jgi:hypothetical protein
MARSVNTIQAAIIADLVTRAAAVGVTITPSEWSAYDFRQLITFVVAVAIATLEQLFDLFTTDINDLVAVAAPQTGAWFQNQMLNVFQANATTPQVVQLNTTTFAPYYPTVVDAYKVIKYCAVVPGNFGTTLIKVAGQVSGLPIDLDTATFAGCLDTAQSFVNTIGFRGITYTVSSGNSDLLYLACTIYYKGQYAAVIQSTVVASIQAYLSAIPFNGAVTLSDLEVAIKAVAGVNDVVFTNVSARADATSFGDSTKLVIGVDGSSPTGNLILRKWDTVAGYIQGETISGKTLNDTITYIAQ